MRLRESNCNVILIVVLAFVLACLGFGAAPANAEPKGDSIESEAKPEPSGEQREEVFTLGEVGGYLAGETASAHAVYLERRFTDPQGHGFAAEEANNFIDRLKGMDAEVVGGDLLKDGPDRKIVNRDGTVTWIQDKYYQSASDSVNAAFENGEYRYVKDGKPMQLEVPADQYDDAVQLMRGMIEGGHVSGVSNPEEAAGLVRKGSLTYQQAVNLTKARNLASLKYDAANGIITAAPVAGITFAIDFLVCTNNGMSARDAVKESAKSAMLNGSAVFAGHVFSSQFMRTKLAGIMAPTAEGFTSWLGDDACRAILRAAGVDTAGFTSARLAKQAARLLNSKLIFNVAVIAVMEIPDALDLYRGRMSQGQFMKNLAVVVLGIAGTEIGSIAGGAAGGAVGSYFAPGVGTDLGAKAGTVIGALAGGTLGITFADVIGNMVFQDDADEMYEIVSDTFSKYCFEYVVSEKEAEGLVAQLNGKLSEDGLKDMFATDDREAYASALMKPLFEDVAKSRAFESFPEDEYEIRTAMLGGMDGIVFIH